MIVIGLLACMGLAVLAQAATSPDEATRVRGAAAVVPGSERSQAERASRSGERGDSAPASGAENAAATGQAMATGTAPATEAPAGKPAPAKAKSPAPVRPVAWLNQAQMNNAQRIVNEGRRLGMSRRAWIAAVACAMQESTLRNLASRVLPESYRYPHEGSGSDHDSVGLFQQRPSTGWGTVKNIMVPEYAARQFYRALAKVPNWQNMAMTYAIQAVQVSAFPQAYAKHVGAAIEVVDAIIENQ